MGQCYKQLDNETGQTYKYTGNSPLAWILGSTCLVTSFIYLLFYAGYVRGFFKTEEMYRDKSYATIFLFIGLAGILLLTKAVWQITRMQQRRNKLAEYFNEPWKADFPECEGEILEHSANKTLSRNLLHAIIMLLLCLMFLIPGIVHRDFINFVIGSFFGFILLKKLFSMLIATLRNVKYGKSTLLLQSMPAFCGEEMHALLQANIIGTVSSIEFTLRCFTFEEVDGNDGHEYKNFCIYEDTQKIKEQIEITSDTPPIPVSFIIPAKCKSTRLYVEKPYFWELVAKAETSGVSFYAAFPVPIYDKKITAEH